jgi:uncharacterized membrane protein
MPDATQFANPPVRRWIWLTLGLFLAAAGGCIVKASFVSSANHWPAALLLVLAVPASVAALAPHLPPLNVALAGLGAAGVGAFLVALDQATALPFGRLHFAATSGPQLLGIIPWAAPCGWFVVSLTVRGAARFLLHRSEPTASHGLRVLVLATLLGTGWLLALGRYGMNAGLWHAEGTSLGLAMAAVLGANVLLQILLTPLLLDKFPAPRPANPLPLLVLVPGLAVLL